MIVFLLNMFLILAHSSGAVPFGEHSWISSSYLRYIRVAGTLLLIVLLWFGISAPLSAIGAYFGSRRGVRLLYFVYTTSHSYAIAYRQFHTPSGSIRSLVKFRRPQATCGHGCVIKRS